MTGWSREEPALVDQAESGVRRDHFADRRRLEHGLRRHRFSGPPVGDGEARAAYERVVREFPDQAEKVQVAKQRLNALDSSKVNGPVARRLSSGLYVRAVSQDERYLVYLDDSANFRLKDLSAEKDTPITKDTAAANWSFGYAPVAISPDSRYLAYTRDAGDANELRVSALDGSGMRVLHRSANKTAWVWASAWTPEGRR